MAGSGSSTETYSSAMAVSPGGLVTLDCAEPPPLAAFWAAMFGGEEIPVREGLIVIRTGWVWLAVLEVPDYIAPTWPASDIPQQIHLDLAVADLEVSATEAVRLGARLASYQPSPDEWRVFLDPAGHPFCLTKRIPIEVVRSSVQRADSTPAARRPSSTSSVSRPLD